ncbi:hypothetical protein [Pelosinus sp. sgz500959]|uniref:hypothetical protein n=1 Tax=Pelosinus sp. sgz500959 TaxID=3242472 RepID=UPI00366FEAFB
MKVIYNKQKHTLEWGLILLYVAAQISQISKLVLNIDFELTKIILFVAIMLIIDWKYIFRLKLPTFDIYFGLLFIYQIYIVIIALLADIEVFQSNNGIIYTLFVIALIIAFSSNNKEIDGNFLASRFTIVLGVLNTVLFIYFMQNSSDMIYFTNYLNESGEMIADRATLALGAYAYVIATLMDKIKKKIYVIFKYIFMIPVSFNIISTSRRGMMIAVIVIACIHLVLAIKSNGGITRIRVKPKAWGMSILAILICFILYLNNEFVNSEFDRFFNSINNAVVTFLGLGYDDMSGMERVSSRNDMLEEIEKFTLIEWLFGIGYNTKWIDFPFLQAIYDMGIISAIMYFFLQTSGIINLLRCKHFSLNEADKFALYFAILGYMNNFYSGTPYGIARYMYIVLIYYLCIRAKKRNWLCRSDGL